jgi:hypothetical protein
LAKKPLAKKPLTEHHQLLHRWLVEAQLHHEQLHRYQQVTKWRVHLVNQAKEELSEELALVKLVALVPLAKLLRAPSLEVLVALLGAGRASALQAPPYPASSCREVPCFSVPLL